MPDRATITAQLGPTNTGKTHRAIERMLDHDSGMIGLPLRLLAREVYDKVSARIGESRVALVTGEEKRVPKHPNYWVCTVEAMPVSREVDFLAVDEVQLCEHPQRGHVFTDRMLHARGRLETMFMGSDAARPMIEQLCPVATVQAQPRLSQLRHTPAVTLAKLPSRSAAVAFSLSQVYEIAEKLRAIKGGAAVVLGALSPRTRNAQVAMFESGEVDHLVATDAIGMGLNLNVRHVAFASLRKFDGRELREVTISELSQIAGRAGRYTADGTFGALSPLHLPIEVCLAIENHRLLPIRRAFWRNTDLDFSTLEALHASLLAPPPKACLRRVLLPEDERSLYALGERPEVRERATDPDRIRLLWEVASIPDFRKLLFELHVSELFDLYVALCDSDRQLSDVWLEALVRPLDRTDGDIDTLTARIASVRTASYIANQAHWLRSPARWQELTRALEDRLSDALHARLLARFVESSSPDRAPRAEPRARRRPPPTEAEIVASSHHPFASLRPLRDALSPTFSASPSASQAIDELIEAPHDRFALSPDGKILDGARPIASLTAGERITLPGVRLTAFDELGSGAHARILRRLVAWTRDAVHALLVDLRDPPPAASTRGLLYRLEQGLGTALTRDLHDALDALTADERAALEARGVHLGARVVYAPGLLRQQPLAMRNTLATLYYQPPRGFAAPRYGTVSAHPQRDVAPGLYTTLGYPIFGPRAVRADIAERVYRALHAEGAPPAPAQLSRWLGCPARELDAILTALDA